MQLQRIAAVCENGQMSYQIYGMVSNYWKQQQLHHWSMGTYSDWMLRQLASHLLICDNEITGPKRQKNCYVSSRLTYPFVNEHSTPWKTSKTSGVCMCVCVCVVRLAFSRVRALPVLYLFLHASSSPLILSARCWLCWIMCCSFPTLWVLTQRPDDFVDYRSTKFKSDNTILRDYTDYLKK